MKRLCLAVLLLAPFLLRAQTITISATVVDRETAEPLSYASVGIKSAAIGTISNIRGEFDFHISADYRNEVIVISMLGYRNFEAPVWSLLGSHQTIRLEKAPIILREVVVTDTLRAPEILNIALSRIEQNYPMEPFMLDGFYRDIKKVGGTHISLLEAAVQIYDKSYEEPRNQYRLRESVRLVEVRQSLGYESRFTHYFDQDNLLEDLLLHNNVRYRLFDDGDRVFSKMTRKENSYFNNHETYVIVYDGEYYMKIYVDTESFAIVHFEFEQGFEDGYLQKRKDLYSKFAGIRKAITFREYRGKMYPSFITINKKINWHDLETNELKFETELFQQLLINKVDTHPTDRIRSTEKMRNYGLQFQDRPYNKAFWDNYNVIKESPLDQEVLQDLERHAPLDEQFEYD